LETGGVQPRRAADGAVPGGIVPRDADRNVTERVAQRTGHVVGSCKEWIIGCESWKCMLRAAQIVARNCIASSRHESSSDPRSTNNRGVRPKSKTRYRWNCCSTSFEQRTSLAVT